MKKKTKENKKKGPNSERIWTLMMIENFRRVAEKTRNERPEFEDSIPYYLGQAAYYQRLLHKIKD